MQFSIANRMRDVEGSMIASILDGKSGSDLINFSRGNPSAEAFPIEATEQLIAEVMKNDPISVLQYGTTEGYNPLRAAIVDRLNRLYAFGSSASDVMICSGAQQAADLVAKVLVNEGDVVICEDPSFPGCLNAFRSYGAKMVGVPVEDDGINLEALEAALKTNPGAKLIYLIPTFQNPTGITMSAAKRRAVYDLSGRYGVPIFEDNPYGDLRFTGEDIPPIKALDTEDRVIYAGSFSKVMAPAFRVGYLIAPTWLMPKLSVAKQAVDVHSNLLFQYVCHRFMTGCDFEAHIAGLRAIYHEKAELMLGEMEKKLHPSVTFTRPEGGLFIMAFLPEGQDALPFCKEGVERGVATVPGIAFAADMRGTSHAFRLNFSTPSKEEIIKGIDMVGKLTYDYL